MSLQHPGDRCRGEFPFRNALAGMTVFWQIELSSVPTLKPSTKLLFVDPHIKASPSEFQAYLLGSALAVACHQRGIIPLHCSAVDVRDGCVLFMGPSGAGKSTLAALPRERGHHVIADDVCYLRGGSKAETWISLGLNPLRL
jgi:hypothetical protein